MPIRQSYVVHLSVLVVCCLLLVLLPQPSQAQTDGVTWEITPGFDGVYKRYTWFPVTVTLANAGPDIRGTLSVRLRPGQTTTYSQPIDLPHNAQKQVVVPVLGDNDFGMRVQAQVTLRDGNAVVLQETVNLNMLDESTTTVGVLSQDSGALPELTDLKLGDGDEQTEFSSTLLRITPDQLPERPGLLQTVDALFVHGVDASQWTEAQRSALRYWVLGGGQLVVGGDRHLVEALDALLPATTGAESEASSLRGLGEATGWQLRDADQSVTLLQLSPRPGAEVLGAGDGGQPLLVRQVVGLGSITVAAFDLQALREVGDPGSFWPRVLMLNRQGAPPVWIQARDQGPWLLQQVLNLPTRNLPSMLSMWGFLLLYILAIGPLNYLLLRRLDRREWAYLTVPLLVLLFSGGAYVWGSLIRGQSADLHQLTIARALPDTSEGRTLTYLTLFSPTRHSYDLRIMSEALVSDLQPPWNRQGAPLQIVDYGSEVTVPELLVDVGAVRPLVVEQTTSVPQLEATLQRGGDQQRITLRNRSDGRIDDVVIARGDGMALQAESLGPGEERTIALDADLAALGTQAIGSSGIVNRQAVLSNFGGILLPGMADAGFVPMGQVNVPPQVRAVPEPFPGVLLAGARLPDLRQAWYVLGWQSRAPVEATLDGRAAAGAGETLYVWTVEEE